VTRRRERVPADYNSRLAGPGDLKSKTSYVRYFVRVDKAVIVDISSERQLGATIATVGYIPF